MNTENFAFWLQGYFELLGKDEPLTKTQVQIIKDHLALVFTKVTPDRQLEIVNVVKQDIRVDPFDQPVDVQPVEVLCDPQAVGPHFEPGMVLGKDDLEDIVKKLNREAPDLRTYCTSTTDKSYWAGRGRPTLGSRPNKKPIC
jgi:hypothetical protein